MKTQTKEESTCCPEFDPIPWDEKILEWKDRKFIKDQVFTIFYMPVNFSKVMKRFGRKLTETGAEMPDSLCLADYTSKWNMDLYLAVDKIIPGAVNVTFSGKFFAKVYEGPFRDSGKWRSDFEAILKLKEFNFGKIYIWYTTCPKCSKKYGKNYVVFLAQIE